MSKNSRFNHCHQHHEKYVRLAALRRHDGIVTDNICGDGRTSSVLVNRSGFIQRLSYLLLPLTPSFAAYAFEGGVGGLGKTKPETGVVFFNTASDEKPVFQDTRTGIVQAELVVPNQIPILVSFYVPPSQPLSSAAAGLEARDLTQPESTYVHVVTNEMVKSLQLMEASSVDESGVSKTTRSLPRKLVKEILLDSILSQKGKFGAYGAPTDVKVKKWKDATGGITAPSQSTTIAISSEDLGIYQVSFTTLTPGLRESERVLLVSIRRVISASTATLVMLVTGTTRQRFQSQQAVLDSIATSWQVVPAPPSRLLLHR
ncbi:hypothetical protein ACA910_003910 [Epithemia clementina (nom. ined.)]